MEMTNTHKIHLMTSNNNNRTKLLMTNTQLPDPRRVSFLN